MKSLQSLQSSFAAPKLLPPAVAGSMVWPGSDIEPTKYVMQLNTSKIADIQPSVTPFKRKY